MLLSVFALSACLFEREPERMVVQFGAHTSTPVFVSELVINGTVDAVLQDKLHGAGWADPKGGSNYDLEWPKSETDGTLVVEAIWTDLDNDTGWRGQLQAKTAELSLRDGIGRRASIILIFGPNGYFELATQAPPDATGQYNGKIVATSCAAQDNSVIIPDDHWLWNTSWLDSLRYRNDPEPKVPCNP